MEVYWKKKIRELNEIINMKNEQITTLLKRVEELQNHSQQTKPTAPIGDERNLNSFDNQDKTADPRKRKEKQK